MRVQMHKSIICVQVVVLANFCNSLKLLLVKPKLYLQKTDDLFTFDLNRELLVN